MRRLPILVSVLAIAGLVTGVAAQEEDEDGAEEPRVVQPEECQTEPRSAEELYAVLGLEGAPAGEATPGPGGTRFPAPPWEPADAETADAISASVRELIACLNAGDLRRTAALLTDRGAQRLMGVGAPDAAGVERRRSALAATPTPLEEERHTRLVAVTDIGVLGDGRAAAFIVVNDPTTPPRGPQSILLIFVQQDDRWLIDDFVGFTIVRPEAPDGSPTPRREQAETPTP